PHPHLPAIQRERAPDRDVEVLLVGLHEDLRLQPDDTPPRRDGGGRLPEVLRVPWLFVEGLPGAVTLDDESTPANPVGRPLLRVTGGAAVRLVVSPVLFGVGLAVAEIDVLAVRAVEPVCHLRKAGAGSVALRHGRQSQHRIWATNVQAPVHWLGA